jgi:hypothetical protein
MPQRYPKLPLTRVDLTEDTAGLPPSLIAAIEADGGACGRRATALRLDFRDLALLETLPGVTRATVDALLNETSAYVRTARHATSDTTPREIAVTFDDLPGCRWMRRRWRASPAYKGRIKVRRCRR